MNPRPNIQTRMDTAFLLRDMPINDLRQMAMERGLKATGLKRTDLVIGLYWHCHELDRAMRR